MSDKPNSQVKLSKKQQQEALKRRQQQMQNILFGGVAVVMLVAVAIAIFVSTRPPEAEFDANITNHYAKLRELGYIGVTDKGFPYLGKADAAVTMEEISSFACPSCQNFHSTTFSELKDKMESGQLKFVFVPVTTTGSFNPEVATRGAYCAMQQGKFWEFHDVLFEWQSKYGATTNNSARLNAAAGKLSLDTNKFTSCLDSTEAKNFITSSQEYARTVRNFSVTPSVFINDTKYYPPDGTNQALDISQYRGLIESLQPKAQ